MRNPRLFEKYPKASLVVFVCIMCLVILLVIEVALRGIFGSATLGPSYYTYKNDGRAFGLAPNYRGRIISPAHEFDVEVRINDFGIRDKRDIDSIRHSSKKKVMILGDSVAFGQGLEYEDMFSTQLENLLREKGEDYTVFSSGFDDGWGPTQYEFYLQKYFDFFQPDIVVLVFIPHNDAMDAFFTDVVRENGTIVEQKLTELEIVDGYMIGRNASAGRLKAWFHTHSLLYQKISDLRKMIFAPLAKRKYDINYQAFEGAPRPSDQWYKETLVSVVNLSRFVEQKNARFVLVSVPPQYYVSERYFSENDDVYLNRLIGINQPVTYMKKYFGDKGIELHDSADFLRKAEDAGRQVFFMADGHFNPVGATVFAEFLEGLISLRVVGKTFKNN